MTAVLEISPDMRDRAWSHLLPNESCEEQAAFLYFQSEVSQTEVLLRASDLDLLQPGDFLIQESDYLELTDDARRRLIKKAHQAGLCLAEIHSHLSPWPAEFSLTDRLGLEKTVPHMLWRLPNRPYAAIVVAPDSFDGLVWLPGEDGPLPLTQIVAGDVILTGTQRSIARW